MWPFTRKPKPAPSTGKVLTRWQALEAAGNLGTAGDGFYAEVNSAWLKSYYASFRDSLFREGVVKWDEKFDCNHFASFYVALAQLRFFSLNFHSSTAAQSLAVCEFWYKPEWAKGQGHAIVAAVTERGMVYVEPQTGTELQLTPNEIASRYLVKF